MKKVALLLAVLMVLCAFVSCDKATEEPTTTETIETTETQPENVVIRIKKDLVDETSFSNSISELDGISVSSDDTFYILTMSQGTYITFLKSKAQEVYDMYDSMIAADGFIEDITYTEDFRAIKVHVDREGFDALDQNSQRLQLITIGAYAMSYQMFLDEGQKTTVIAVYSDTKEEAMALSLPITM